MLFITICRDRLLIFYLKYSQIYIATDRIIIHQAIASSFLAILTATGAQSCRKTSSQSAQISLESKLRVKNLAREATAQGARLIFGGGGSDSTSNDHDDENGFRLSPMIIADATKDMRIWNEEIFGLAIATMIVDGEEEAIAAVNSTECGFNASVFTNSLRTSIRLAREIYSVSVRIPSIALPSLHQEVPRATNVLIMLLVLCISMT